MPRGDGTGPGAPGAGGGKGQGTRPRKVVGAVLRPAPAGYCVCPSCGVRVEHQLGGFVFGNENAPAAAPP